VGDKAFAVQKFLICIGVVNLLKIEAVEIFNTIIQNGQETCYWGMRTIRVKNGHKSL